MRKLMVSFTNKKRSIGDQIMIGKRIYDLRKNLDLTQEELAKVLGLTHSTISGLEKGKSDLSTHQLEILKEKYAVNITWLVTGDGEMFLNQNTNEESPVWIKLIRYDMDFYEEVVKRYQKNPQKFIRQVKEMEKIEAFFGAK